MATFNQKCVINKISELLGNGQKINLGKVMRNCGYSDETSDDPKRNLLDSRGFQKYLAKIDDKAIIDKWEEWAVDDKDKRIALDAGDKIMKLKQRYPDPKIRISKVEDTVKDIFTDKDPQTEPEVAV